MRWEATHEAQAGECDKIHVYVANLCDISLDGDVLEGLQEEEVHPPRVMVLPPPLTLEQVLTMTFLWSANLEPHTIIEWAHVNPHTTIDWCHYLREVNTINNHVETVH